MGTHFETVIAGVDESYAGQASGAVFQEIDRIEGLFSRFNPSSEISQMNRMRPGDVLIIGLETFECLNIAERVREETEGAFDINVRSYVFSSGPPSERRGGEKSASFSPLMILGKEKLDAATAGASASEFPYLEVVHTRAGFEARMHSGKKSLIRCLELDLGGIGKGYALDVAQAVLADWGIVRALIHGGTSTAAALGSPPGINPEDVGWPVGVGGGWPCPGAPRQVFLKSRALSGSGIEVKGKHILDPRTGAPAKGHQAAWVSHPSAAEADALSTAFMVMNTEEVEHYCAEHPDVWTLIVKDYGDCRVFNPPLLRSL